MSSKSNENKLFVPPPYCKTLAKYDEVFEEDVQLSKLDVLDPAKVLQLCENLTDRTTKRLEVKVNKFVSY